MDGSVSIGSTSNLTLKHSHADAVSLVSPSRTMKMDDDCSNLQAPAAIPVVASGHGRSLPGAAYGSRLHTNNNQQTSASSSRPQAGVTIAAAPPRILQRPKEAMPGMRSDGSSAHMSNSASQERKTVEQRQEEYRLARERIFGSSLNASSSNSGSSKR